MIKRSASLVGVVRSGLTAALIIVFCLSAEGRAQTDSPAPTATPAAASSGQAVGGTATPPPGLTANPPAPPTVPAAFDSTSGYEYRLTILVVVGALGVLLMLFFLMLRRVRNLKADDMLRTFGVVLIIMGTLFLITAGYSSIQIAPALGLFGTIAGYLVGRADRKGETEKEGKNA